MLDKKQEKVYNYIKKQGGNSMNQFLNLAKKKKMMNFTPY